MLNIWWKKHYTRFWMTKKRYSIWIHRMTIWNEYVLAWCRRMIRMQSEIQGWFSKIHFERSNMFLNVLVIEKYNRKIWNLDLLEWWEIFELNKMRLHLVQNWSHMFLIGRNFSQVSRILFDSRPGISGSTKFLFSNVYDGSDSANDAKITNENFFLLSTQKPLNESKS